jgi:hypothetical protein
LTVLAGGYIGFIQFTTQQKQTQSQAQKRNKHNHNKPIFFLDPVRSHQIWQDLTKSGKISPDPATTVEENNEIR